MNPETEFREGLDELAAHYKEVLKLLGEDPEREGLVKTPMRVAKAMQILTRGYTQDPHKVLQDALFEEKYNQMVIVKDIDFFSMCEHHMLPFYGKAHQGLHPGDLESTRCDGSIGGEAHVHADERRGETELRHYHKRLQRRLQFTQYSTGVYEPAPWGEPSFLTRTFRS